MTRSAFLGSALTVVLALGASSSGAHHRPVVVNNQRVAADSTQDCECRARGKAFTIGEQICLNGTIAICDMNQNVTTWRSTRNTCPNARLSVPVREGRVLTARAG
jgi:hypothetical protein